MYQHHGLKGAPRIVFEDLCRLSAYGGQISITELAMETGYSRNCVASALNELKDRGIIEMEQDQVGMQAEYQIVESPNLDFLGMLKGLFRFVTTWGDERAYRMAVFYQSSIVTKRAETLRQLAEAAGGDIQERAEALIEEHGLLDRHRVWELVKANRLEAEINELIEEARSADATL